jgi:hypothetical protein
MEIINIMKLVKKDSKTININMSDLLEDLKINEMRRKLLNIQRESHGTSSKKKSEMNLALEGINRSLDIAERKIYKLELIATKLPPKKH